MTDDPAIETSPLSQKITSGGKTISVEIFRLEGESEWTLEVVDEFNNSTVWDDTFKTDSAAVTEARKAVLADGVGTFIGPEDGKSDGAWR